MNKKESLALFLGMLSGDGCLPIKHNGEGYRDYAVQFYNTDKNLVELFSILHQELFNETGNVRGQKRNNKKELFAFCKYSKETVGKIKSMEFPEGVKRDVLRIPKIIKDGEQTEKLAFIKGFLITDGCIRKNKTIIFHSGSKLFLNDLADLIESIIYIRKPVKEYTQRRIFRSYQLNLNKKETNVLLSNMPTWDNGTPAALSSIK